MALYHLTTKENLPDILQDGLIPDIGKQAKRNFETVPSIYLCTRKEVPYWNSLLGATAMVKISGLDKDDCEERDYGSYKEYLYDQWISPERISRVHLPRRRRKIMRRLCKKYLHIISRAVIMITWYYSDRTASYTSLDVARAIGHVLSVRRQLDFWVLSDREIKKELRQISEDSCDYSFCDQFRTTGRMLWQQIPYYPKDKLYKIRMRLYWYLRNEFGERLGKFSPGVWE